MRCYQLFYTHKADTWNRDWPIKIEYSEAPCKNSFQVNRSNLCGHRIEITLLTLIDICTVLQNTVYSTLQCHSLVDLICSATPLKWHCIKNMPVFLYTKWFLVMCDLTADYILKWCCWKWNSHVKCSDMASCAQHSSRVNKMPQSGSSKYKNIINRIF